MRGSIRRLARERERGRQSGRVEREVRTSANARPWPCPRWTSPQLARPPSASRFRPPHHPQTRLSPPLRAFRRGGGGDGPRLARASSSASDARLARLSSPRSLVRFSFAFLMPSHTQVVCSALFSEDKRERMSGAPPAKPWQVSRERERGNAPPTSLEVSQVAQQAAASQAANLETSGAVGADLGIPRGDDGINATTSYGQGYGSAFGGTGMFGGGYGSSMYGGGYGSSMYGSSMYGSSMYDAGSPLSQSRSARARTDKCGAFRSTILSNSSLPGGARCTGPGMEVTAEATEVTQEA